MIKADYDPRFVTYPGGVPVFLFRRGLQGCWKMVFFIPYVFHYDIVLAYVTYRFFVRTRAVLVGSLISGVLQQWTLSQLLSWLETQNGDWSTLCRERIRRGQSFRQCRFRSFIGCWCPSSVWRVNSQLDASDGNGSDNDRGRSDRSSSTCPFQSDTTDASYTTIKNTVSLSLEDVYLWRWSTLRQQLVFRKRLVTQKGSNACFESWERDKRAEIESTMFEESRRKESSRKGGNGCWFIRTGRQTGLVEGVVGVTKREARRISDYCKRQVVLRLVS